MAKGQVDIGFKADISNLKDQLSNISGITDKEAKQMVASLQRSYSQMSRDAKKSAAAQKEAFKGFKESWTELNAKIQLIGVAYSKIVGPALQFIDTQMQLVDGISDLSAKTNVSADNIQALQIAFEQTGLSMENVDGLLSSFSANFGKAATAGGRAQKNFDLLNISLRDSHGVIRDANDVFEESIKKIGELKTPTEQASAAMRVFGGEGANLLTAFGDISNFESYIELSKKFGIDVGPAAAEAASKWETANYSLSLSFKHAASQISQSFGTDATNAVKIFGGSVSYVVTFVTTALGSFVSNMKNSFSDIGNLFTSIADGTVTFEDLGNAIQALPDITLGGNFVKTLDEASSAADQAAEDFFMMGFQLENMGGKSKQTEEEIKALGSTAKKAVDNSSIEAYIKSLEKEQGVFDALKDKIDSYTNALLSPQDQIQFALDQDIAEINALTSEYENSAVIMADAAQAKSLAIQKANNDWFELEEKQINDVKDELLKSFDAMGGAADAFEQKAHEVFNAEVIDPIMNPINAVQGGLSGIAGMIGGPFWGPLASGLADAFLNSRETIGQLKDQLMSIPEILNDLPDLIADFTIYAAKEFVPTLIRALPQFITKLLESVPDIITGLVDSVPLIISALIDAIPDIIYAIIDSIPYIIVALVSAIPKVAIALVEGVISYFVDGVWEMAKAFWEALKGFFVPSELFDGKEKKKSSAAGDYVKEIFTLGMADTNTFNDTPAVMQAPSTGMRARFGAGDYVAAARTPKALLKQVLEAQPEAQASQPVGGSGYIQWADGAFAYDSFTKRHIRKKSAIFNQLYGKVA